MRIAIIGAGKVGGALARGWARAQHEIVLGVRDSAAGHARTLAAEIGATLLRSDLAAAEADILVLALPWSAAKEAVATLGDLSGKIVIDCMNPLAMMGGALGLELGFSTSGAETLAAWAPGARIVKTLNQVGAELLDSAATLSARPLMFMAGDDAEAKRIAGVLVEALGFEAMDAGGLRQARLIEPLAMVWINQALMRGAGRDWALAAVRRRA